ncbi:MAG: Eco29kI family restriction endonuclease [Candidatus Sumerlaeota bacterium]|nr:Eco29kI family restriction endonuclease [Candidatus Sumerlaeota bacterium]
MKPLGDEVFNPRWNLLVDGFGHHDQGKTRTGQKKSAWDTLHPGRQWAGHVQKPNDKSAEAISAQVVAYLGE